MSLVPHRKIIRPQIVQPGRPGIRLWIVFLITLLLGLLAWQVFDYGRRQALTNVDELSSTQADSDERIALLEKRVKASRFKIANAERASQIDRLAVDKAREEIASLQNERAELKKQVAFLQGLIESGDGPLEVKGFKLTEEEKKGLYSYAFRVTQAITNIGTVKGEIAVRVEGRRDGKPVELKLSALRKDKKKLHKMRFQRFQDVEGSLLLPEGVEPTGFVVEVRPRGKKLRRVLQVFDWMTGQPVQIDEEKM